MTTITVGKIAQLTDGPVSDANVSWHEEPVPELPDGHVLVEHEYYSVDPTHKIYISPRENYIGTFAEGTPMPAYVVGKVIASKAETFPVGSRIAGLGAWGSHSVVNTAFAASSVPADADAALYLTFFNPIIGLTAYVGVDICDVPRQRVDGKQHCLVVSGAAGAVGSIVGQLAKAAGAYVIGIAGGPDKCALLKVLGYDAAIDYKGKDADALVAAVKEAAAPCGGVDSYFDNVGGIISGAVVENMKNGATLALCGAISGYTGEDGGRGWIPFPAWNVLLFKRCKVQPFICLDHPQLAPAAYAKLAELAAAGKLAAPALDVLAGTRGGIAQLNKLLTGQNTGKTVVKPQ